MTKAKPRPGWSGVWANAASFQIVSRSICLDLRTDSPMCVGRGERATPCLNTFSTSG
jgi:hypothetical protein